MHVQSFPKNVTGKESPLTKFKSINGEAVFDSRKGRLYIIMRVERHMLERYLAHNRILRKLSEITPISYYHYGA